jgi:CII-binding regulator of phage lambda lysogenization HflD
MKSGFKAPGSKRFILKHDDFFQVLPSLLTCAAPAWLVVNGMRAENVQAGLLAEQRAANIWRKVGRCRLTLSKQS